MCGDIGVETEKGIALPDDFAEMLQAQPQIRLAFEQMRPSCQRGYADWITQAADDSVRVRTLEHAVSKIEKWGVRHNLIG